MFTHPHVTIACHLLAARHLSSRHLRVRQTSECRGADPQANQNEPDDVLQF